MEGDITMDKLDVRCANCEKKYVCKYADHMLKTVNEINIVLGSVNNDLPFSMAEIDCNYFSDEKTCIKDGDTKWQVVGKEQK